jgi:hypothetical protein
MPHGDDAPSVASRCPDEGNHPGAKVTNRDIAGLSVILPAVLNGERAAGEHCFGLGEIKAALT